MGRLIQRAVCAALSVVAVLSGAAGCAAARNTAQTSGSVPPGCYSGGLRLTVQPSSAQAGQVVTACTNTAQLAWLMETTNYGLFGTLKNGRFRPVYFVFAVTGNARPRSPAVLPYSTSAATAIAGTGLGNRPFHVQIPPVAAGRYVIQFAYTVKPGAAKLAKVRAGTYNLCAPVTVRSAS